MGSVGVVLTNVEKREWMCVTLRGNSFDNYCVPLIDKMLLTCISALQDKLNAGLNEASLLKKPQIAPYTPTLSAIIAINVIIFRLPDQQVLREDVYYSNQTPLCCAAV